MIHVLPGKIKSSLLERQCEPICYCYRRRSAGLSSLMRPDFGMKKVARWSCLYPPLALCPWPETLKATVKSYVHQGRWGGCSGRVKPKGLKQRCREVVDACQNQQGDQFGGRDRVFKNSVWGWIFAFYRPCLIGRKWRPAKVISSAE